MAVDYTIEQLQAEFAERHLEGFLWSWLREQLLRVARTSIVSRYNPAVYSPTGVWNDEALSDLANDFIIEQGIGQGAFLKALAQSPDIEALLAYVGRSFRNYIVDQRPRSTERNVFERLRDLLDSSPDFMRLAGTPPNSFFGLAEWSDAAPEPATDEDMASAHRFIPEGVEWVAYESGQRQSPGLSSADLQRTALAVMRGMNRLVSARQLMSLIKRRFVLDASEVEWDDASDELSLHARTDSPLDLVAARELAEIVHGNLTPRQRDILFEQLKQGTEANVRSISAALGIGKSTVSNEMQRILACFRDVDVTGEQQLQQVLEAIGSLRRAS